MKRRVIIFTLTMFLAFTTKAIAQIYINEFSSSTSDNDWIEIYNGGQESFDLNDLRIRDASQTNKLELEGEIKAGEFKVLEWGNKLNNPGDTIKLVLKSNDSQILDLISYGQDAKLQAPISTQTAGRKIDGGSEWVIFDTHSKGKTNSASNIAPTLTPTPQPTEKPTSTPKPSIISTPSNPPITNYQTQEPEIALISPSVPKFTSIKPSRTPLPILGASSSGITKPTVHAENQTIIRGASHNNYRYIALGFGIISLSSAIIFFIKIKN